MTRPPSKSAISRALHTLPWNERCPWCPLWPCHILTVKEKGSFIYGSAQGSAPQVGLHEKDETWQTSGSNPGSNPFFSLRGGVLRVSGWCGAPTAAERRQRKIFHTKSVPSHLILRTKNRLSGAALPASPSTFLRTTQWYKCLSVPHTPSHTFPKTTNLEWIQHHHAYPLRTPRRRPGILGSSPSSAMAELMKQAQSLFSGPSFRDPTRSPFRSPPFAYLPTNNIHFY